MTIAHWLESWNLYQDGEEIRTHSSVVVPVHRDGQPLMLKVATMPEERNGANLMVWWGGIGAAQVLAHEGDALLMERATGPGDLWGMSRSGHDDEAIRILVGAVQAIHQPREGPQPTTIMALKDRFAALWRTEPIHGGVFSAAAALAQDLVARPENEVVLHGDVQHHNLLDFGDRGWLFIDPKGILGESTYDFANIFCNPDEEIAQRPGLVSHRADLISSLAGIDRTRLLQWVVAYGGLSATWHLEEGSDPSHPLKIAAAALDDLAGR